MRRLLGVAGLIAAGIVVAGCGPPPAGGTMEHIPYCPKQSDLCIEAMGVHSSPDGQAVGTINLKTVHIPRHLEIKAQLWYWSPREHGWLLQDEHLYKKGAIALPSQRRTLTPALHADCANGRWALDFHVYGTTSKGVGRSEWLVWPGSRKKKAVFLGSTDPIAQKYWPGEKIRCLA